MTDSSGAACVRSDPPGPSAHDAALSFLVDQLERIAVLVRTHQRGGPRGRGPLARLVAETLRAIERTLDTGTPPGDIDARVDACLTAKVGVVDRAVGAIGNGEEPGAVLDGIDELCRSGWCSSSPASRARERVDRGVGHARSAVATSRSRSRCR